MEPRLRRRASELACRAALAVGVASCGLALAGCDRGDVAAPAPCGSTAVRITVGQFGVGHGHFGGALLFWNQGRATCTLEGYPTALVGPVLGGGGVSVRDAPRGYLGGLLPGTTRPPLVTLAPHAVASAVLEGRVSPPRCATDRTVHVGLPGAAATTSISLETSRCSRLEIHPIVPGSSGVAAP